MHRQYGRGFQSTCRVQEIERAQTRSLRILNLGRDCLPSISLNCEVATGRQSKRIQTDQIHPCYFLLPYRTKRPYELREENTFTTLSETKRHKQSFIARARKYM